jgi:DnaK suppressor protein
MRRKEAIQTLRTELMRRRDSLRSALAGDSAALQELRTRSKSDLVDFAVDAVQDEITAQLAEVESRELAYIENALERMQEGGYGMCEACNREIPLARLQALPSATLCVDCQRDAERAGGGRAMSDWGRLSDAGFAGNDEVSPDADAASSLMSG